MTYCQKCGHQNEDDAAFCSKCGATLTGVPRFVGRRPEDRCQEEQPCTGGKRSDLIFWGIIIILVGLWIIFEFVIKKIEGMPPWIATFEFWWIFALVIGIAILIAGIRMIRRGTRPQ